MANQDITGLILAGGRGSRMGGVDKGLQPFQGEALVLHAMRRLRPQVGALAISANRHLSTYEAYGVPAWPDPLPDYPGPLAGMLSGLTQARTPWLLTVPCDAPRFPEDLAARLHRAALAEHADIALPVTDRTQPAFCLVAASLRDSLSRFLREGHRKVEDWTRQHRCVHVPFNLPDDDPLAFANLNTLDELRQLEQEPTSVREGAPPPGAPDNM